MMHIRAEALVMSEELEETRYPPDLPYPEDNLPFCPMSEQYHTNMHEPSNYQEIVLSASPQ